MGEFQLNASADGFKRMIADVEHALNPVISKIDPVIRFLNDANIYLVLVAFLAMFWYLVFVRKHTIINKLTRPTNYFAAIIILGIYLSLMSASFVLGKDALDQEIKLSLDFIAMPMAVKLLGPVVGCFFGMIQYCASFLIRGQDFNLSYMLVAGLSAMLYGRFLYKKRTQYIRCFVSKLLVNVLCNVFLVPFYDIWKPEFVSTAITSQIVIQIILVPIQALAIYFALIVMRKVRKLLAEVSWSL